jgi:phosphohistidine phosphatase
MLMRHAKSDWSAEHETDFDRPLNRRGIAAAAGMASFIAKLPQPPQWIVTSSAARALATAEAVADQLEEVALLEEDALYEAGLDDFMRYVRQLPNDVESVLLIGHNPTLDWLVGELSGNREIQMKTATLAMFNVEGTWDAVRPDKCSLILVQNPRDLPDSETED